jgi:NAD(P)-dependent dehydrogenase (short-subunit alcohol dehydrogenase family)
MNVQSLFSLAGKTALVTGGGTGLGSAMATALGSAGAKLVLVSHVENELAEMTAKMQGKGFQCQYVVSDLSQPENVIKCGNQAESMTEGIDIVVNAAGVNLRQPFMEVTPQAWQLQLALHLGAPFFLTQALAPKMKERGYGRIINIASLQSYRAFANSAPYGAGKGGVTQLTRAIAQEWSQYGINCNAIGPGFFPTPLTARVFADEELAKKHAQQTCIGRNGVLEDLYGVTVFLASEASSYITGQIIMLDGGYTAK